MIGVLRPVENDGPHASSGWGEGMDAKPGCDKHGGIVPQMVNGVCQVKSGRPLNNKSRVDIPTEPICERVVNEIRSRVQF